MIAVDIVYMSLLALEMLSLSALSKLSLQDEDVHDVMADVPVNALNFAFGLEIILLGIAVWGAFTFTASKVMVGIVVHFIGIFMSCLSFNVLGAVMSGLFAYPHVFLFKEISLGIMTEDNYYNEEQSCCCV